MRNHTPSSGEIADLYITHRHTRYGVLREDGRAEFERWLEQERASVREQVAAEIAVEKELQRAAFLRINADTERDAVVFADAAFSIAIALTLRGGGQ